MSNFNNYMEKYKVQKGESYTHVGMSSPRGAFHIPDSEKSKFFSNYHKFISKNRCDLIEKHKDICYLLYDLDFKCDSPVSAHVYTQAFIMEFIARLAKVLKKFFAVDELKAFVMQKEISSPQKKDGLHIVFPYIVSFPSVQYLIREELLVECEDLIQELPITNSIEDVIDECVIERNGWMMYGSYKENNSPYLLTDIYNCSNPDDIKREDASVFYVKSFELTQLLSIRTCTVADLSPIDENANGLLKSWELQMKQQELAKKKLELQVVSQSHINLYEHDLHTIRSLVLILSPKRAETYTTWIEVGWCLHNIDFRLFDDWVLFSQRSQKHADCCELECRARWCSMKNSGLHVGSLHMWAKIDNPTKYLDIIGNSIEFHLCKSASCKINDPALVHHMVAAFKSKYGHFFKCSSYAKRTWYEFDGVRWNQGDDDIEVRKRIREDLYEDYLKLSLKYKSLVKTAELLDNTGNAEKYALISSNLLHKAQFLLDAKFRKRITEEASEHLYWFKTDVFQGASFEEILDTQTHLIGLQNGVYDLKLHAFREGRCEDYITLNTQLEWKSYDWQDPIIEEIMVFLRQVIPNDDVRKYILYTLATFLSGEIVHERFFLFLGGGGNGKSKLIELFENALGKYCSKLSISALTQKRTASSAATPDIVRLKGRRFVVLQEPNEKEVLQVGIMKEMTGGDKIVARGLNQAPIEYKPQFHMILACNSPPTLCSQDDGSWRRIRLIKFTSVFKDNPDPENKNEFAIDPLLGEKLKKWSCPFFWILTQYYQKYKKFDFKEPDIVKLSTREYQKSNDTYVDFVDLCIVSDTKSVLYAEDLFSMFVLWFRGAYPDRKCPCRKEVVGYFDKKYGSFLGATTKKKCWSGLRCNSIEQEERNDICAEVVDTEFIRVDS